MLPQNFHLKDALIKFNNWIYKNDFKEEDICIVTCGDFDMKCLNRECKFKNLEQNPILKKYINIKEVFS